MYLKKMATRSPEVHEQVLSILMTVANTNNPLAQQAILESLTLLRAPLCAVNTFCKHLDCRTWQALLCFPAELQQFIAQLVQGGQMSSAIALLKALLLAMSTNDPYVERWDYEHLVFDQLPAFVMNAPRELLNLLCTLLDQDIYHHYIRFRKLEAEDAVVYARAREASTITRLPTFDVTEHMHVQGTRIADTARYCPPQSSRTGYQ